VIAGVDVCPGIRGLREQRCSSESRACMGGGRSQQAVVADLAVESRFEASFAFAAFPFKFGHTASAARRLNSGGNSKLDHLVSLLRRGTCSGMKE
jgi:hypothetical protein